MPIVPRVEVADYNNGDLVDNAIEEALASKNIGKKEKADPATLNEEGRHALNRSGVTIDSVSRTLAQLLDSSDEEMQFKVAKLALERHAGKLEGSKDTNTNTIILNFGGELDPSKPNIFNPTPVDITPVQE